MQAAVRNKEGRRWYQRVVKHHAVQSVQRVLFPLGFIGGCATALVLHAKGPSVGLAVSAILSVLVAFVGIFSPDGDVQEKRRVEVLDTEELSAFVTCIGSSKREDGHD